MIPYRFGPSKGTLTSTPDWQREIAEALLSRSMPNGPQPISASGPSGQVYTQPFLDGRRDGVQVAGNGTIGGVLEDIVNGIGGGIMGPLQNRPWSPPPNNPPDNPGQAPRRSRDERDDPNRSNDGRSPRR